MCAKYRTYKDCLCSHRRKVHDFRAEVLCSGLLSGYERNKHNVYLNLGKVNVIGARLETSSRNSGFIFPTVLSDPLFSKDLRRLSRKISVQF
jgi:hypothetical protein